MGGHSGLNISEDRGNAVVLVTLVLQAVVKAHPDVRIISLTAGDKRNAIAREASAVLEVGWSVKQSANQSHDPVTPLHTACTKGDWLSQWVGCMVMCIKYA